MILRFDLARGACFSLQNTIMAKQDDPKGKGKQKAEPEPEPDQDLASEDPEDSDFESASDEDALTEYSTSEDESNVQDDVDGLIYENEENGDGEALMGSLGLRSGRGKRTLSVDLNQNYAKKSNAVTASSRSVTTHSSSTPSPPKSSPKQSSTSSK